MTWTLARRGRGLAAAKEAGLYEEALAVARRSPYDPRTLRRAARDFAGTEPAFAVEAGLLAVHWLAHGHGYETTSADVAAAVRSAVQAAERSDLPAHGGDGRLGPGRRLRDAGRPTGAGAVITRAYLHVAGPAGVGKTAFVEALLRKIDAWVLVARCVRDDALNEAREWVPDVDPELARYEAAGADGVARFAFPSDRAEEEDFFLTDLMADHSEAVVLEGDCPLAHVDLRVFVSPPLPNGGSLFVRTRRDRSSEDRRQDEIVERVFREPGGVEALLEEQLGSGFVEAARRHPEAFDRIRADLLAAIRQARETPRPPVEHWAVAHGHAGIERAQLVVVNVRDEGERENGERLVTDLLRLRKDDEIFNHILGVRGTRIPVTAVVANLRDRNDRGLGKAIARVKRAIRIRSSA